MGKRILILGGGTGGTIVANLLARGLRTEMRRGDVTVNMLSASDKHVYQPAFLYVAFGRMQDDEFIRDQKSLLDPLINFRAGQLFHAPDREILNDKTGKRSAAVKFQEP